VRSGRLLPDILLAVLRHVLAALRDVQARFVAPDTIQRQSLRLVEGAAAVCAHLDEIRSLKQLH